MFCAGADSAAGGSPYGKVGAAADSSYGACPLPVAGATSGKRDAVHPAVRSLLEAKHFVVFAWLFVATLSLSPATSIFGRLNFEATPLRGSPLAHAADLVQRDFPGLARATPLVVMISCSQHCESVVDDTTFQALWEISKLYQELNSTRPGMIAAWDSPSSLGQLRDMLHFGLNPTGSPRVSEDGQTLLSVSMWILPEEGQDRLMGHVRRVRRLAAALSDPASPRGLRPARQLTVQGMPALKDAFKQESEREFFCKDAFVVPFTLAVFLYLVRSWRLAVLVAVCMVLCLTISLGALVILADRGIHLNTMTPAMMAATCVAMCVDYALFVLSRFQEERARDSGLEAALSTALLQGGSVVAVSGTILIGCYFACLLFPGDMIFSLALGNLCILFLCILASLTFTPCAIALFPDFFANDGSWSRSTASGTVAEPRGPWPAPRPAPSAWFKLGVKLTSWPWLVVVPLVIYTCMAPVAWSLTDFRTSSDVRELIPAGELLDGYEALQKSFPGADAAPVLLRMSAGGANGVRSDRFFEDICGVVRGLVNATRGTPYRLVADDFRSVALLPTSVGELMPGSCPEIVCLRWRGPPPECPSAPSAEALLAAAKSGSSGSADRFLPPGVVLHRGAAEAYNELWQSLVSADGSASVVAVAPSFDLRGTPGRLAMDVLRQKLPRTAVYCRDAIDMDMMDADYARFPVVMALSLCLMCALIGYAFKAVFMPVNLFLTVFLPLLFLFGLLSNVFQTGKLDGLGIPHINSEFGLHWSVPILVAPILTGLAVDYDLFLFARVYELRQEGFDDRAAVVGALAATGPIINGAGLVMALAFGAMLLSSTRLNCEVGFALCSGVLLDTFLVRPFLVPTILMVGGRWNYWPQKMPEATRSIEDLHEVLDARLAAAGPTAGGTGTAAVAGGTPAAAGPASALLAP